MVQSNQLRTTDLVDVFAIGWQFISNMSWCCHIGLSVISCCFSLPWQMTRAFLLYSSSLSRTHSARSHREPVKGGVMTCQKTTLIVLVSSFKLFILAFSWFILLFRL